MKKIRKGKKMLVILLIAVIAIIATIAIVNIVKKSETIPSEPEDQNEVIPLPETTYSDMQVKNIAMELRKGNSQDGKDETVVTFEIHNTTDKKVESQLFKAVLIDDQENVIAEMPLNPITNLDVGEVQRCNVVYKGDLTATKYIKLIEE